MGKKPFVPRTEKIIKNFLYKSMIRRVHAVNLHSAIPSGAKRIVYRTSREQVNCGH